MESFELVLAFLGKDMVSHVVGAIAGALTHLGGSADATTSRFNQFGMRMGAITAGIGAGMIAMGVGVGVAMFKMAEGAATFQAKMVLVSTHAGWTRQEVDKFANSVLNLATTTGKSAEEIANGLFYVASAGFHGARALDILTAATREAAMGHTDVADTSRALTSVLLVGIKAASGASRQLTDVNETINLLNETIGHGKMKLSELNAALSTGILESARVFGIGMNEMGGALDVLTNHGMRADEASTRLRMSFALMGAPSGAAISHLRELGLTTQAAKDQTNAYGDIIKKAHLETSTLASVMRTQGLIPAIKLLNEHLRHSGLSADQANAEFVRAFGGGRSATAIMALQQHLQEFQNDTDQIKNHAGDFAAKWANYTNTMEAQQNMFNETIHATELAIGMALIPVVQKLLQAITPVLRQIAVWVQEHSELIAKIAPLVAIILVVGGAILFVGGTITMFIFAMGGIIAVVGAVIAPIAFLVGTIGSIFTAMAAGASLLGAIGLVISPLGWVVIIIIAIIAVGVLLITHWKQVQAIAQTVWTAVSNAFRSAVTFIRQVIHNILEFLRANWPLIITILLGPLGFLIAQTILHWDQIVNVVRNALTTAGNVIRAIVGDIVAIWKGVAAVATVVFTAIAAAFMVVVRVLNVVWDVVTTVLRVGLIGVLILIMLWVRLWQGVFTLALDIIRNAITKAGEIIGWLRDRWVEAFNAIVTFLTPFWNAVVNAFNFIRNWIVVIFNYIRAFITMIWTAVWNFVVMVIRRDIQVVQNVLTAIRNFITMIWNAIYNFIAPIVKAIWDVIVSAWNAIYNTITTVINAIRSVITTVWNAIWNVVKTVATNIWNTVSSIFNSIKNTAVSIVSNMVNAIVGWWNGLSQKVGSALRNVWNTITSTLGNIAGNALNLAKDIGTSIVNGIVNGLKGAWGGLVSTFNNLASQLPGPIKGILGIKSPSSVFARQIGQPIAEGIAVGIHASGFKINDAGTGVVTNALTAMGKAVRPTSFSAFGLSGALGVVGGPSAGTSISASSNVSNFTGAPFTSRTLADALVHVLRTNTPGGASSANNTQNLAPTININGVTDPNAVALAVKRVLAELTK